MHLRNVATSSQGKAVEVTVNSKEENTLDFCLDFVQEFGLCTVMMVCEGNNRFLRVTSVHKATDIDVLSQLYSIEKRKEWNLSVVKK